MIDVKAIAAAVEKLDPADTTQWTADGVPKMDVLQRLSGVADLTRAQFNEVVPNVTREALANARKPPEQQTPPAAPKAPNVKDTGSETEADPVLAPSAEDIAAQVDEIELAKQAIAKKMDENHKAIGELKIENDEHLREHDRLVAEQAKLTPSGTDQSAIRAYLKSAQRARAARAGHVSPLDRAMGGAKKTRELMNKPPAKE